MPESLGELWRLRGVYAFAVRGLRPPPWLGGFLGFMRLHATGRDWLRHLFNARNEGVPGSSPDVGLTPANGLESRYATFGFSAEANIDEGAMWPTSFALKELTAAEEARIAALVTKAVS